MGRRRNGVARHAAHYKHAGAPYVAVHSGLDNVVAESRLGLRERHLVKRMAVTFCYGGPFYIGTTECGLAVEIQGASYDDNYILLQGNCEHITCPICAL